MFDTFCAILMTATGYALECFPLGRQLNYYDDCDRVVHYYKHVQTKHDFDGKWFGHYCTTEKEMATWDFKNQS